MLDHLKRVAIFSVVAKSGGFSTAARSLGMTPANVSHQIKKLEEHVGVALFSRSTRNLTLTPEGRKLVPFADDVVRASKDGLSELRSGLGSLGQINVVIPEFLIDSDIYEAIFDYLKKVHPIKLSISYRDNYVNLIENGYDLAVVCSSLPNSSLKTKALSSCDWVLLGSHALIEETDGIHHPSELGRFKSIAVKGFNPTFKMCREDQCEWVSLGAGSISSDSFSGCFYPLRKGLGIQRVPRTLAQPYLDKGLVVELLPDWHIEPSNISAVWAPDLNGTSLVRSMVDHITTYTKGRRLAT